MLSKDVIIGYMMALENEGVVVTAQALSDAAEITLESAETHLSILVKKHMIRVQGGTPVKYRTY